MFEIELLIWIKMDLVLITYNCWNETKSLGTFLSFSTLAFVRFLLLRKNTFLVIFKNLFLTAIDSQRILRLILSLVNIHFAVASIWVVINSHVRLSEYVFQISLEEYQTCFLQLPYIYYLYHHWCLTTSHNGWF